MKPLMKKEEPSDDSEDEDEERPQVEFYRKHFSVLKNITVKKNTVKFYTRAERDGEF